MLDLHSNKLKDINELEVLLTSLKKVIIDNNPIVNTQNWKLSKYDNHYLTIENYFSKKNNENNRTYKLPVKVLLLGNHGAGKSTLLNYLIDRNKSRKISPESDSTHIIRIENFPKTSGNKLPEIIYFDFGGQDYYHGIYKAFLTNDSINILLWNDKNDKNKIRIDNAKNILTRDFTKEYWLNQLKYHYVDRYNFENKLSNDDVILTVQTHADEDARITRKEDIKGIKISNEFFISLNQDAIEKDKINKINLDFLESNLKYEIEEKKKLDRFTISQPLWYGKFLSYIFNYSSEKCIDLKELLKKYNRKPKTNETSKDILNFLMEDLDQLHRQGLILYYKDFYELREVAWLNPSLLTKYIHTQILTTKDLIESRGNLSEEKFLSIAGNDKKIIQLLQLQKVIFHNKESKNYIIPSFLPLANDIRVKNNYDILTFGLDNPSFVLKFEKFIPFGIVNQLICHFGNNPDSKNFWRDQLIFTLNNSIKVLIKLDFNNLEIAVFLNNKNLENSKLLNVERYIYTCLIAIYYDIPLLTFAEYYNDQIKIIDHDNDESIEKNSIERDSITSNFIEIINKVPNDLFLSIDNQRFVKVSTLNSTTDDYKVLSFGIESIAGAKTSEKNEDILLRTLSYEKPKELPIYKFQNFTNKALKKMKKIFISYSKDDLPLVHEFQDHLSSLKRDNIIATWYCTELLAGGEWDKDISQHFEQSDIICFMVSSNLMRTEYIHKYEIAKAFERRKNDINFKIVPIILDFCSWSTKINNLGDFTALPYTAKPICDFDNKNMAWYVVVECIRFMIESNEQPMNDDWFEKRELPKNLKNIFERIVNKSVDKGGK